MFDALLKSKFYTRSKSEIKLTKKRIEIIKRKRTAMEKFLRNDVADLLKNGVDSNAYTRVEQLYADQKLSQCYEFVEQSCSLILTNLSAMEKQRECLDECKEAISTLMFAAARFADLPELRELRSLFAERYGNYLEPYVNQEFIKNLKAEAPTKEIKIQMMQEIAFECGIKWDSKALEHKLYKPPQFVKEQSQYGIERKKESHKTHHQNVVKTNVQETEKKPNNNLTEVAKKDQNTLGNRLPYKPRVELEKRDEKQKDKIITNDLPYKSRDEINNKNEVKHGQRSPYWSSNSSSSGSESTASPGYSTGTEDSASDDLQEEKKLYGFKSMAPPPYVITDSNKKSTNSNSSSTFESRSQNANLQRDFEDTKAERRKLYGPPPYVKSDSTSKGKIIESDNNIRSEEAISNDVKQVPKSMRIRRPLKPVSSSQTKNDNEVSKSSSKILISENRENDCKEDEEEKKMDKLLSHYSRKPTKLPLDSSLLKSSGYREAHAPTRTGSLPVEPVANLVENEERKGLERAVTCQPDSGLSPRGHVHPKLPDYDDFVARLAAFRAGS